MLVGADLAGDVIPGASSSSVIQLDTQAIGIKSGQISFSCNDSDETLLRYC